ncbi:MAG TPA: hypothetical protein VFA54_04400 [Bryobacterales bacterium]|jgi:hypothetical protein|nr:hypothetical protein [Bryobacterales bacterium]
MSGRKATIVAASCFLLAVLQLLAALVNPAASVGAAVVVGVLTFGILRLFDVELERAWSPLLIAAGSSAAAIGVRYFGSPATADRTLGLSPLVAFVAAAMVLLLRRSKAQRCGLCNRRIGRSLAFECPRCGLTVCDQTCWIFEHCRCRLCEQNRVPVFSPDGRWWDRRFGPRMKQGRCQLCLAEAADADLRACANCGRPQCRPCWDFANGQCSRCQWTVDDLPEGLKMYMLPGEPGAGRDAPDRRAPIR